MGTHLPAAGARRVRGGFRSLVATELGEEQICGACAESWPLDGEFFIVTGNSIGYLCKACVAERARLRRGALSAAAAAAAAPGGA